MVGRWFLIILMGVTPLFQSLRDASSMEAGCACCAAEPSTPTRDCCRATETSNVPTPCCPCGDACDCFAAPASDPTSTPPAAVPPAPEFHVLRTDPVEMFPGDPGRDGGRKIRRPDDTTDLGPPRAGRRRLVFDSVFRL